MIIDFYKMTELKNKINKTLENPFTLENVFFKSGNIDLVNPFIRLTADVTQYNYCYIRELERYYFIDNIIIESNNIKKYFLSIDVLMSYKNQIMNNKTHIIESENILNADNINYNGKNSEIVETFNFPNSPFNENTDILITVRG